MGPGILHIHIMAGPHGSVEVLGTRHALMDLRAAIEAALSDGDAKTSFMAASGEHYLMSIREQTQAQMDADDLPYDPCA